MKKTLTNLLLSLSIASMALAVLAQSPLPKPSTPSSPDGIWLGTLNLGSTSLRIQLHLQTSLAACTLDSVDQGGFGIPCTLTSSASDITVDVPTLKAHWTGTLSADGNTLTGTFTQGGDLPLAFARQAAAIPPTAPKAAAMDPALPPVALADLQTVLDKDLAAALTSGALAPSTHTGITIGIVQHGVRRIFTYGPARPDSVFEIGSISKTFTGLILAQMVEQKKVRLDEPVRDLLPSGTVAKPSGPEITLLDLSDQHSGLPRLPDNLKPADESDPYADYDAAHLYAYLRQKGVTIPPNAPFGYSNLGVGLLGHALSVRAGITYEQLLHDQVTAPLHMTETAVSLTPSMKSRFIPGYDADHNPAHAWDLNVLAGAGGIRSTAADMLTYLEAQLHPNRPSTSTSSNAKSLPAAVAASHVIHGEVGKTMHIALNWFRIDADGSFWHNGGTGAYSSYALFNPAQDFAFVVLSNCADDFPDTLGPHIAQRMSGKPAISLGPQPK